MAEVRRTEIEEVPAKNEEVLGVLAKIRLQKDSEEGLKELPEALSASITEWRNLRMRGEDGKAKEVAEKILEMAINTGVSDVSEKNHDKIEDEPANDDKPEPTPVAQEGTSQPEESNVVQMRRITPNFSAKKNEPAHETTEVKEPVAHTEGTDEEVAGVAKQEVQDEVKADATEPQEEKAPTKKTEKLSNEEDEIRKKAEAIVERVYAKFGGSPAAVMSHSGGKEFVTRAGELHAGGDPAETLPKLKEAAAKLLGKETANDNDATGAPAAETPSKNTAHSFEPVVGFVNNKKSTPPEPVKVEKPAEEEIKKVEIKSEIPPDAAEKETTSPESAVDSPETSTTEGEGEIVLEGNETIFDAFEKVGNEIKVFDGICEDKEKGGLLEDCCDRIVAEAVRLYNEERSANDNQKVTAAEEPQKQAA